MSYVYVFFGLNFLFFFFFFCCIGRPDILNVVSYIIARAIGEHIPIAHMIII